MEFLKRFLKDLISKPALKRGARAAVFAFVAVFGPSLLGWGADVTEWANDASGATPFPDPAILVKALVSAAVAGATFVVSAIVNAAENASGRALFGAKTNTQD